MSRTVDVLLLELGYDSGSSRKIMSHLASSKMLLIEKNNAKFVKIGTKVLPISTDIINATKKQGSTVKEFTKLCSLMHDIANPVKAKRIIPGTTSVSTPTSAAVSTPILDSVTAPKSVRGVDKLDLLEKEVANLKNEIVEIKKLLATTK